MVFLLMPQDIAETGCARNADLPFFLIVGSYEVTTSADDRAISGRFVACVT